MSTETTGATNSDNAGGSLVVPKDVELKPEAAWAIELADGCRCVLDFNSGGWSVPLRGERQSDRRGGDEQPRWGHRTEGRAVDDPGAYIERLVEAEKIAETWGVFVSGP